MDKQKEQELYRIMGEIESLYLEFDKLPDSLTHRERTREVERINGEIQQLLKERRRLEGQR